MSYSARPSQSASSVGVGGPGCPVSADVLVGLLTPLLLVSLLGTRALSDLLLQLGLASEELFRGERLPTIPLSPPSRTPFS